MFCQRADFSFKTKPGLDSRFATGVPRINDIHPLEQYTPYCQIKQV